MKDLKPPVTCADLPDDWIDVCRQTINDNGYAVRASGLHPMIEIKSLRNNTWGPLGLPDGGCLFTNFDERNLAMNRLLAPAVPK